jgi:uncharacterized protein with von Willebrand factor type A (vWA) domain
MTSSNKNTDKQLEKFNRQRSIALLEKISKMLYKMFSDKAATKERMLVRFSLFYNKLKKLGEVHLDSEYLREMKSYIDNIPKKLATIKTLDEIRESNVTALNRIQKIKNSTEYKKEKYPERFEM